jgi:putative transposase
MRSVHSPYRLLRSAIDLKPATILSFHRSLVKRKYQELFSPKRRGKPGPQSPSPDLIAAIVEMKRRNPNFGYERIADQIALVFDIELDKRTVRRVLASHYRPESPPKGPSWLTFLGHNKDSLWSMDLFRCESLTLKTHWVMVVMDHITRRLIGFAVHRGIPDGPTVRRMFGRIAGRIKTPRFLSSDNDPLFEFHRWKANLRVLDRKL